ncbi:MAG: PPC domain-containing protein [Deltaproteobacteria bacterium]|nr:PPC domain-containing protein [Deltaproteobacteria bacterium]
MRFARSFALSVSFMACGSPQLDTEQQEAPVETHEEAFTSDQATLLNFEFDAELTGTAFSTQAAAQDQLLYTIGHLNGQNSVGRLDKVELSNWKTETLADGTKVTKYHVKLPVAWKGKTNLPTSYTFKLPRRADYEGFEAFTTKYKDKCVDWSAHEVDSGSMWYYFRPNNCTLDAADIVSSSVTITTSTENTTGKYPEFHKVWEDNGLDVVAIFGKYEVGGKDESDAGVAAYNSFVASVQSQFGPGLVSTPANVGNKPGVDKPDVSFTVTRSNGRRLTITALLVDEIATAPASFDERYSQISAGADLIAYNGHAGLGQNVRALVRKGKFVAGKYQIVFMNGCDTFAYVDGYMAQMKMALNPDDPKGTKYLDFVTNAMPAYFHSDAPATIALTKALLDKDNPKTYDQIFTNIDRVQVVLATGEEDNVYFPGYPGTPTGPTGATGTAWSGLDATGEVAKNETKAFETPVLPAGKYTFTIAPDSARPGGDADLYVRVGSAPTTTQYNCRPYLGGSSEECVVTLTTPSKIYVAVIGYASAQKSAFVLRGRGSNTPAGPTPWAGKTETSAVTKGQEWRFETPLLPAGRYEFSIAQPAGTTGGDADLYVKTGAAPTLTSYDCRPYEDGSVELCAVQLAAPAKVSILVQGYAAGSSPFTFSGVTR